MLTPFLLLALQVPVPPKPDTATVTIIRRLDTHLRYDWPEGDSIAAAARAFVKDSTAVASEPKMRADTAWVEVRTSDTRVNFDVIRIYTTLRVIRVERRRGVWVAVGEEPAR